MKEEDNAKDEMIDEIKYLQYELSQAQEKLQKFDKNEEILASLFEKGMIDEEG